MVSQFFKRLFFIKKTSWSKRHFVGVLLTATLLAMAISLIIGLNQSLWFDEVYSVMLAKQPIGELFRLTAIDTHPPLYYLLLKAWMAIFGSSELALRSLSILAFGGVVIVAGLLARRMFGVRAALITLPFIVFAPFMLRYGFEIRMYAIASLIGIAATYVLVMALRAKNNRTKWWLYVAYSLLVVVGVYTLYYLALLWVAHALWLVWTSVQDKKPFAKWDWPLAYVGSAVLFLPWIPTFISQIDNGALTPVVQSLTLDQLLSIVTFNFLYQPSWQVGVTASILVIFVISAITYFAIKAFKNVSLEQRKYLVLLALYVVVPIILLMLVSLRKPMYVERYLAHIIIGGLLFIGATIAIATYKNASKHIWLAAGMLLAVMAIGTVHLVQIGNYNFQRLQQPTANQVAAYVEPMCSSSAAIVAEDPYFAMELSYYLPNCQVHFYSETAELSGGYAMLSNSALHLYYPIETVGAADRIFYIHDGPSTVQLSARFHLVSERAFHEVSVQEFSAE